MMTDIRSTGAKAIGAGARLARALVDLVMLGAIGAVMLGIPVGAVYVIAHFVLKYW